MKKVVLALVFLALVVAVSYYRAVTQKERTQEQILSYYKKRYRALPKDLSPYEKRVALAEIRDETAQKFSIPLSELDEIRTDNELDY